jgi:type VI secretion system protein ImpH
MRRPDPSVAERLFEEPYVFDFFQAVRLLEQLRPGLVPVGHDGPPWHEVVRFVEHLSLTFPPSAIHALAETPPRQGREAKGAGPPRMTTPFFGLLGAGGALPTVYTESLIRPEARRHTAARDFLDLFHHRLVALFYRAWEKYNVPALWERGQRWGDGRIGDDPFSRRLFDFIGLGLEPLRDRLAVRDGALLYYAGFFAQQHRSACVLESLLVDYFGRPARVATFHGQWLRLPPDQQSRCRNGAYNRLGIDTVVGSAVWDDQSKFRVRVGPLGLDDFRAFLPGGPSAAELMDLVRCFAQGELDFDVQLVLKAAEVPACKVSRDGGGAQLGRCSWLKRREFTRDADDAVFRPPPRPLGPGVGVGVGAGPPRATGEDRRLTTRGSR